MLPVSISHSIDLTTGQFSKDKNTGIRGHRITKGISILNDDTVDEYSDFWSEVSSLVEGVGLDASMTFKIDSKCFSYGVFENRERGQGTCCWISDEKTTVAIVAPSSDLAT